MPALQLSVNLHIKDTLVERIVSGISRRDKRLGASEILLLGLTEMQNLPLCLHTFGDLREYVCGAINRSLADIVIVKVSDAAVRFMPQGCNVKLGCDCLGASSSGSGQYFLKLGSMK